MKILTQKNEEKLDPFFEKYCYLGAIFCMDTMESSGNKKLVEGCNDIACYIDYFLRYNQMVGIDWPRYKVKIENLEKSKEYLVFDRLRAKKAELTPTRYTPIILLVVSLVLIVLVITQNSPN